MVGHWNRKCFTLIELLVVISIISILASLLLPALNRARSSSEDIVCKGNLRSCGQAWMMYLNDYDERLPVFGAYLNGGWVYKMSDYLHTAAPVYGKPRTSMDDSRLVTRCHKMAENWDYWYFDFGQTAVDYYRERVEKMNYRTALSRSSSGNPMKIERYGLLRDYSATADGIYYGDALHHGHHNVLFLDFHIESRRGFVGSAYHAYLHYYY